VGFFLYAIFFQPSFFLFISIGLLALLSYLIPFHRRLETRRAEKDLHIQNLQESINLTEAEIHKEEIAIKSFQEKVFNYSHLKIITEKLSRSFSCEDTSKVLSSEVSMLFGDKDSTIILYLFHSKTGELGISSSSKGQMRINIRLKNGDVFDQWIVKTMQPLLIEDVKTDYRFDIDKIGGEEGRKVRSLMSVPLMVRNKALGILRIDSSLPNHFKTEELRFLSAIGDIGALSIENAQLYEHVEELAIKDGLTNLYLRRYLLGRLSQEITRKLRRNKPVSFIMFDLDFFKSYNDTFGHVAGDIVLKTIASELKDFFHEPGTLVCRYGGEEFCVLIPDCPKKTAVKLANKIRSQIERKEILLRREKTNITISGGVACFPDDAKHKEELISKADQALYKAKERGRNCICEV